ncbi:MAG: crossover junction endodeoxyribonuclease RuvC [Bacteroidota bacterium]
MSKAKERIILGIDPGTVVMGYGVIRITGSRIELVSAGVLKLAADTDHLDRLRVIFRRMLELIDTHLPDELAIEEPFFGKNVQSMLKLGRAQGVAMAAALYRNIPVTGYSPRLIKQSITGKGGASKQQVSAMLQRILAFEQSPKHLDATDAVGVALCHHFQTSGTAIALASEREARAKKTGSGKKSGSKGTWSGFLNQNPDRVA